MHLVAGAREPLSKTCRERRGGLLSLRPFVPLAYEVSIHAGLIGKVVGNRAIDLFEAKDLKVLTDGFGRLAPAKRVNKGIQRDASPGNVITAFAMLHVLLAHTYLILLLPIVGGSVSVLREQRRAPGILNDQESDEFEIVEALDWIHQSGSLRPRKEGVKILFFFGVRNGTNGARQQVGIELHIPPVLRFQVERLIRLWHRFAEGFAGRSNEVEQSLDLGVRNDDLAVVAYLDEVVRV
ncbi:MAG: hypothetical protein U0R19_19955 [Bryobacteraceae bacterium]